MQSLPFASAIRRIKQIADGEGKTVGVIAVGWIQGEADYWGNGTPVESGSYSCRGNGKEWTDRVKQLHNDLFEDLKTILNQNEQPAWFIHQVQGGFINNDNFAINQAQTDLCDNVNYYMMQPVYQCPNVCDQHLTGNGYKWYGELFAQCIYDVLIDNYETRCLKINNIAIKENKILIDFIVPNKPLIINKEIVGEIENLGFVVKKNGVKCTIVSVDVFDYYIIINTEESLIGTIEIGYGTMDSLYTEESGINDTTSAGNGRKAGAGNICDSASIYSYTEAGADEGSGSNPVLYSPNITGHYPMNHFLVAFKKSILVG